MCLTPVTLTREIAGHFFINNVPCNKCLECVKDRQNAYIVRTLEEQKKRGNMCFFTLTYSPEAVPMTDDLEIDEETGEYEVTGHTLTGRRADVSHVIKMFKQKYKRKGEPLDFGYMVSLEYGPKTNRPHYHGVLLGLTKEQCEDFLEMWSSHYGFVAHAFVYGLRSDVEKVARYCAKYMIKNDEWNYVPAGCEKPRIMTSQFYGMPKPKEWNSMVQKHLALDVFKYDPLHPVFPDKATQQKVVKEIIKRRTYNLGNGRQVKLPVYYRRKIFYTKVAGKDRACEIQRMVTYNLQRDFDKTFKEELHNLATLYDLGEYSQVVDRYNAIHEDSKYYRALRYASADSRYMVKSFC